jgi:nitrogen fixation protein NifU and related proteins
MNLNELYQEIILDHCKHPRNTESIEDHEVMADEKNPSCGDHIRLRVELKNGQIEGVKYDSKGCAISTASASIMSEMVVGLSVDAAKQKATNFIAMMRSEAEPEPDEIEEVLALSGVRTFPMRIKCATMCWHAFESALDQAV